MSAQNAQIQGESDNRVCIVGVGASTAIGMDSPSTCAAVRAGIAGFADHPFMIDRNGEPMVVAMAPCLSEELGLTERCVELAKAAAAEAIEPLRGLPGSPGPVPLFIGLPESRPGLPNAFGGQMTESLTMVLRERIRTSNLSAISAGHSAGFLALKAGFEQLCTGRTDFCLVGGVDSYLEPETLEWLEENEQLHNTTNAYGFIPGEAAGFCLLARTQAAKEYGLTPS